MITTREAAEIIGVHASTVVKFINSGRLPAQKIGTSWALKRADVEAFAETYDKEANRHAARVANGRKASLRAGGKEVSPALAMVREFIRNQSKL